MRLLIVVIAGVVTFCAGVVLLAGPPLKTQQKGRVPEKPPVYASSPFDPSVDRLPKDFRGNDIVKAYEAFRTPPKDEFESSAEYAVRLRRSVPEVTFAFLLEASRRPTVRYDADNQTLLVEAQPERGTYEGGSLNPAQVVFAVRDTDIAGRSYVGGNVFGATAIVAEHDRGIYGLITGFPAVGKGEFKQGVYRIALPMDPERARLLKYRIGVLLVCQTIAGERATSDGTEHMKPTFDQPSEIVISWRYLTVRFVAIWLYDRSNGEILLKD